MQVREIIEAEKTDLDYGEWQAGPVPSSKFPIKKPKRLKYSKAWSWRVVTFRALHQEFLVLVSLNEGVGQYSARLAIRKGAEVAVICTHELHVSHKNWHCHFVKGDIGRVEPGYLRDRDNTVYFPSGGAEVPCTIPFNITLTNALLNAAERFRFKAPAQAELPV